MTLLERRLSKALQEKLPVDSALNPPLTSVRAGKLTLSKVSIARLYQQFVFEHLLGVVSSKVNGTLDLGKLREGDGVKLVVVGDGKTTSEAAELRQVDLGQVGVVIKVQIGTGGQVGGREVGNVVAEKTQLTGQVSQRWDGDGAGVAEGQVLGGDQVGELNAQLVVIGRNNQGTSDVLDVVDVDGGQGGVGSQIEVTDGGELDTSQGGQTSIGDADTAGLVDTLGEGQSLQVWKRFPVDGTDRGELREVECGQQNNAGQTELIADGIQVGSSNAGNVGGTISDQTAGNLLDTVECNAIGSLGQDGDVAFDGLTAGECVGIGLGGNVGDRTRFTAVVYIQRQSTIFACSILRSNSLEAA